MGAQEEQDPKKFLHLAVGPDAETIDEKNKNLELKKKEDPNQRAQEQGRFQNQLTVKIFQKPLAELIGRDRGHA